MNQILQNLQCAARDEDEAAIIRHAAQAASANVSDAVPLLLKLLRTSSSIDVRHAAALAASDLGTDQAVPLLFSILRNPKFRDDRGTFVYALWPLHWQRYSMDLAALVCDRNYEVREMAVKAFEKGLRHLPASKRLAVAQYLIRRLHAVTTPPAVRDAIAHVIDLLVERQARSAAPALSA